VLYLSTNNNSKPLRVQRSQRHAISPSELQRLPKLANCSFWPLSVPIDTVIPIRNSSISQTRMKCAALSRGSLLQQETGHRRLVARSSATTTPLCLRRSVVYCRLRSRHCCSPASCRFWRGSLFRALCLGMCLPQALYPAHNLRCCPRQQGAGAAARRPPAPAGRGSPAATSTQRRPRSQLQPGSTRSQDGANGWQRGHRSHCLRRL
jgi:hypothetical protein